MKSKKQGLIILIIVAVATVLLFNMRTIIGLIEAMNLPGLTDEEFQGRLYRAKMANKDGIFQLALFLIIAIFNYSIKDLIFPKTILKNYRSLLVVTANIVLIIILVRIDLIFESRVNPRMTYISLTDALLYSLKHIAIVIISILLPYFLIQILRMKETEARMANISEQKAKAELETLRDQISPHFFFNTLSSLSAVIRNSPKEEGLEFIQEMSETYRYTLTSQKFDVVELKDEIDFLDGYIFLLKKRFGDILSFHFDIPESEMSRKIPPMALQTLIENGINHNIITVHTPLRFDFFMENEAICVKNNLIKKESSEGLGSGLENLNNRFLLITDKQIWIEPNEEYFIVKLPLI